MHWAPFFDLIVALAAVITLSQLYAKYAKR